MEVKNPSTSIGIFIFYFKPTEDYIKTLRYFLELSLGLNKILIYSIQDYPEYGLYDIMEDVIVNIRNSGIDHYHYIMTYLENTLLVDTDFFKETLWLKMFDVFSAKHIVLLYKDSLELTKPLLHYEIVVGDKDIVINQYPVDSALFNRFIIIDNYTIEEFCHNILNIVDEMNIYQFLIERRLTRHKSLVYCNFVPSILINLFYNYKYKSITRISVSDIIPVYVSTIGMRLLSIYYRELKVCQRKRISSLANFTPTG